ncbi:Hypothetical predicted protein [Mytilus galloprovincialis]|uniref:Uncharacterized protein n=1 Tax=Mytilus galloprovincialis TaxID=29158 RepID=A0A8B6C196_MYTGA|nr:Hypothetical predicted protein [Mytilus galloprovincialis]
MANFFTRRGFGIQLDRTDLFLQDFPWSGGDERGEESSPIHFGTVFKEEPISGVKRFYEVDSSRESLLLSPEEKKKSSSKKGVKRRLITEDKENDQKMKREQLDRHSDSIRPMCGGWGGKSSQIKQLTEVIGKMEENHSTTIHILKGMITQLEKEKPRRQNIITL